MHRFYLPPGDCRSDSLVLTGGEAHHASQVLRLRAGDDVTILDGSGVQLLCRVDDCRKKQVNLSVVVRSQIPPLPFSITLFQAVPKGKIMDSIIQKATELGVSRIVPLLTERVAIRLDEAGAGHKGEKWQQVAIEAIKQSGSAWLPRIEAPLTPEEFLERRENFDLSLIASLQPGARHPRVYFDEFRTVNRSQPETIGIWIGPEGDFTADEVAAVQAGGARPITLGRLVLRVETAATYCLSVLNYEFLSERP